METTWQDLRFGWRMMRKSYGLSLVALLSLGIGIGASTAIFTVFDAVVLRPLPVRDPDRLVVLTYLSGDRQLMQSQSGYTLRDEATGKQSSGSFSYPLFLDFRAQSEMLSDVFAFYPLGRSNVRNGSVSELASALTVTGGYFRGLGVRPWAGRLIADQDEEAGEEPVVVLGHAYWQRRFGGDPEIIGQVLHVNEVPSTVVGIAPPEFYGNIDYASPPEIFVPLVHLPRFRPRVEDVLENPNFWWFGVMGRLKSGATLEQAQASLRIPFHRAVEEIARTADEPIELPELVLKPGRQGQSEFRRQNSEPLLYSLAIVGLVLLIACANVANLLLARGEARQREIAMRLALGSGRRRLVRQLLTEGLMLSGLGGFLGVLLAFASKDLLFAWLPLSAVPRSLSLTLDLGVLAFTAATCLFTALLFALAPALQITRMDLVPVLRENAGTTTGSGLQLRLSRGMVVTQIALSLIVLVGGGLFLRTLQKLDDVDVGFNPENLLLFRVDGTLSGYEGTRLATLYREIQEQLERIPGARSVAMAQVSPISGSVSTRSFSTSGYTPQPDERVSVHVQEIGGSYFELLETPILLGRDFNLRDDENAPKVAVVNEALAERYFGGGNPVGRRFAFSATPAPGEIEIVGVAKDMKYDSLRKEAPPTVYTPAMQAVSRLRDVSFLLRSAGDPENLQPAVRRAVQSVDPGVSVFGLTTQSEQIRTSVTRERKAAQLSSLISLIALILATIGLYGLMSHMVARRRNEIGIRMALGAGRREIFSLVLRQGMFLALLGITLGLLGAFWSSRLLAGRLYGVTPTDLPTFIAVSVLLALVALLASYLPALRAVRTDPMAALRCE